MQSSESTPVHQRPSENTSGLKEGCIVTIACSRAAIYEPRPCPPQEPYAASRIRIQACRTYDYAAQTPPVDRSSDSERPHKVRRRTRHLFGRWMHQIVRAEGVIGMGVRTVDEALVQVVGRKKL
jgi:hypothetical protein